MKVLNKIKTFHVLIILVCGISFFGKGIPVYGDDYVKVWDSGNIIPNPVYAAALGDLDRDGKAEIIVADNSKNYNGKIYIFENTGDNAYKLVWDSGGIITGNDCFIGLTVGDLDKDGKREIITLDHQPLSRHMKVYVLENTDDNSYQLVWDSGDTFFGEDGASVFVDDADSDGKSEMIIGTGWGHANKGKIYVFENTGDNSYQEVWNSGNTLSDTVLPGAVGDLDKDGKKEIIVGSGDIDPQIHVFENNGDNSYALVWNSGNFFGRQMRVSIGDGDQDGKEEIIAGSVDKLVCVFENTGDDIYQLTWTSPLMPHYMHFVYFGDQDNDGRQEIIAPCQDKILYLFENTGDDNYEIVWHSGDSLSEIAAQSIPGDADGDGKGEIIVPCYDGKVYVFEHWMNQPPVVEAGLNQTVEQETYEGAEVTQIGHLYDADGDALTYQWKEGDAVLDSGTIPAPNEPPTDADVSLTYMFPPGVHTVSLFLSDGELSSSDDVLIIVEDTLPPVSTLTTNPTVPDGLDGWFKSAVQVIITAEDRGSGIKEIYYKKDSDNVFTVVHGDQAVFSPGDGTYTIEYYAVDKTSHEESPHNFYSFKVDTVNPGTTAEIHGNGDKNTYINHATILLEAADTMSGIKEIHYMINNSETVVSHSKASINLNQVGTYTIEYWAMDNAGNRETHHSLQIEIISPHTGVAMIKKITANLPNSAFAKNAQNLKNALLNKLDQVIAAIDSGQYADAVKKLLNDIYKKMDGCFNSGVPDKNDWIIDCQVQSRLNNWIKILIIGLTEIRKR